MPNGNLDEWDIARGGLRSISAPEIKTFWNGYIAHRKDASIEHGSLYSRWRRVADDLVISLYLTNRSVGLFVRGQRGERYPTTVVRLSAYEPSSASRLAPACAATRAAAISPIFRFLSPIRQAGCAAMTGWENRRNVTTAC
jgi:hypothetical protein